LPIVSLDQNYKKQVNQNHLTATLGHNTDLPGRQKFFKKSGVGYLHGKRGGGGEGDVRRNTPNRT